MSSYTIPYEQRRQIEELQRQVAKQRAQPYDMQGEMERYFGQVQQGIIQEGVAVAPTKPAANPLILLLEMS